MQILIIWARKIVIKKWPTLLIIFAISFGIVQLGSMSILGNINNSSSVSNTKHRQHVAAKKVLSKWEEPQHSKLMKDPEGHAISLRGTSDKHLIKYFPNVRGKFTCFESKKEITYIKVNDDYCDCPEDGSDEPGTNACNNGVFYCEKTSSKFPVKIPSYKVNDGVCDCCDGSDEWMEISILNLSNRGNNLLKQRALHCENKCKTA